MICSCFIDKLELIHRIPNYNNISENVIYPCVKSYVEKMSSLPKNAFQILHSVILDIFNKCLKPNRDTLVIAECYRLLFFIFDCIGNLPSDLSLPKDSIVLLLKLSEYPEFETQASHGIERFLNMSYTIDPDNRHSKVEYITLQPNLIYTLLKNGLGKIKKFVEVNMITSNKVRFLNHQSLEK